MLKRAVAFSDVLSWKLGSVPGRTEQSTGVLLSSRLSCEFSKKSIVLPGDAMRPTEHNLRMGNWMFLTEVQFVSYSLL